MIFLCIFYLPMAEKCGWYTCADNADCKKVNGKQKCICQDGFAGNGIDVCDSEYEFVILFEQKFPMFIIVIICSFSNFSYQH